MAHKHGLIGYGGMANWHHENIRDRIPQIDVVAAYDIRPEARAAAEQHGIKAYDTLEGILGDRDIDIEAGNNAGIRGVLFDPDGFYPGLRADLRAGSMAELTRLLLP